MALFLALIIVAVVLGIVGVTVHGLFYLLIVGIVVLVADLGYLSIRASRRRSRRLGKRSLR